MSVAALGVVSVTAVRVRGLVAGGCGFVNGLRAAAAARRGRAERLQLAVDLWRNAATFSRHQCCLPAGIGACSHDELARHDVHDAARRARRVQSQAQRQWWPAFTASIGPAVAGLDTSAAFGVDLRVRHVENLLLTVLNLLCGTSVAASKRSSQSRRRTSCTAAAELLADWRARAPAMAAAAAGAAGGATGCTTVVATCSSCTGIVLQIPHMHAQHAHARVRVHAHVHVRLVRSVRSILALL